MLIRPKDSVLRAAIDGLFPGGVDLLHDEYTSYTAARDAARAYQQAWRTRESVTVQIPLRALLPLARAPGRWFITFAGCSQPLPVPKRLAAGLVGNYAYGDHPAVVTLHVTLEPVYLRQRDVYVLKPHYGVTLRGGLTLPERKSA